MDTAAVSHDAEAVLGKVFPCDHVMDAADALAGLEHLWNTVCHEKGLSLLCAYPRTGESRTG